MRRTTAAILVLMIAASAANGQEMTERYGSPTSLGWQAPASVVLDPVPLAEQANALHDPGLGARVAIGIDPALGQGQRPHVSGALSLHAPIVGGYSVQGDGAISGNGASASWGAAARGLWRNDELTAGATAAFVQPNVGGSFAAVGPEARLDLGQGAIEAWGGVALDSSTGDASGFGMLDLSFYPHDDWRLTVGGALVAGSSSVRASSQYMMSGFGLPFALNADARLLQDGTAKATLGVTGYIGGNGDTVLGRDRQDFLPNRALDLMAGMPVPTLVAVVPPAPPSVDPEEPSPEVPVIVPDPEPEPVVCPPGFYLGPDGCELIPVPM